MTDQLHLIDAPEWGPAAVDLLAGSRDVEWIYELVHARTNRFIRTLRGVRDFRFENNVNATIRSGGSCTWQGAEDIDWMEHRLRAHQRISHRGQSLQWTVGTFIVESPTRVLTDKSRGVQELQLFDAMYRLDVQTSTVSEWVARKGSNIIGTVRHLLDRQGLKHALEDSAEVFASQMSWEAGTTYLRMVNDMLASANFTAIYADPQGVLRAGPARAATSRGVAWTFRDDSTAMRYAPEVTHNRDTYSIPNEVVLIARSDDPDTLPMSASARDTSSPYGTMRRGMVITKVEEVDAASQKVLQARADLRLKEVQRPASTFTFQHLPLPLEMSQVVRFVRTRHDVDVLAVIEKTNFDDGTGLAETTVREVVS